MNSELTRNVLPTAPSILISGSNESLSDRSKLSNPLKTESTIINAAVVNATLTTERIEITFMKFFFLLERRYRRAIKKGKFNCFYERWLLARCRRDIQVLYNVIHPLRVFFYFINVKNNF